MTTDNPRKNNSQADAFSQTPAGPSTDRDYSTYCRTIPDFPKKGILFKDITPLLQNNVLFADMIDDLAHTFISIPHVDKVVCMEARGFLLGSALAYRLHAGLVPVRKKGKLPWKTFQVNYDLEYGNDGLEVHQDAIREGEVVVIVDDVLATGGTARATVDLIRKMGGSIVGCVFLLELVSLQGRLKLRDIPVVRSLLHC